MSLITLLNIIEHRRTMNTSFISPHPNPLSSSQLTHHQSKTSLSRLPKPAPLRIDTQYSKPALYENTSRPITPKKTIDKENKSSKGTPSLKQPPVQKKKILSTSVFHTVSKDSPKDQDFLRQTYNHNKLPPAPPIKSTFSSQASTPRGSQKSSNLFKTALTSQFQGPPKINKASSHNQTRQSSKDKHNESATYHSNPHSKEKPTLSMHISTIPSKTQRCSASKSPVTPRAFKKGLRGSFLQSKKQLGINDFDIGACRGEGRFGRVFVASHKVTGWLVALKRVRVQEVSQMLDQFIMELKLSLFVNHPNLVKTYGFFREKQYFYIVMEMLEQGSLYRQIKTKTCLQEDETAQKVHDVCQAVQYLHQNDIIHRDIKPQNIVTSHGVCKLCDLGWAIYSKQRRNTYCGTLDYVSPDLLSGQSYDNFVDVWAVGVLTYEMLTGKAPFYHASKHETMNNIRNRQMSFPEELPLLATRFIARILQKLPNEVVTISDLLKQPLLTAFDRVQPARHK